MSFDKTYQFNYEIREDHQTKESIQIYIGDITPLSLGKTFDMQVWT